jgi:SAM-dependent methyltransferase
MDLDQLHVAGYGDRVWTLAHDKGLERRELKKGDTANPAEGLVLVEGRMPFPTGSIESIISHHCLEHIGPGFIRLMGECHRILKPGGIFRIVVPLFPSHAAITDPDHVRMFTPESFKVFCGDEQGNSWMESFSTPYSSARFKETNVDYTPRPDDPRVWWTDEDARELRITLQKHAAR